MAFDQQGYDSWVASEDYRADIVARETLRLMGLSPNTDGQFEALLPRLQSRAKNNMGMGATRSHSSRVIKDLYSEFGGARKASEKVAAATPAAKAEVAKADPEEIARKQEEARVAQEATQRAQRKAGLTAALDRYQSDLDTRITSTDSEYGKLIGDTGVSYDSHIKGLNTIQNPYTTAAMNEQRGQAMRGMNTALEQSKGSLAARGLLGGAAEGAMAAGVAGQYAVNDANLVQQGALSRTDWQQQQAGKLAELAASRQSALGGLTSQKAQAMQGLVGARNQFGINRTELLQNEENYANDNAYKQGLLGIRQGELGLQQAEFQDKQAQADYARRTEEEQAPWRFATNAGQMLLGAAGLGVSMTPWGAPFAPILTPVSAGLVNSGIQGFTKTPIAGGGLPYDPKAYEGARQAFQTKPPEQPTSQDNSSGETRKSAPRVGLDTRPMPKGAMWDNKDLYSPGPDPVSYEQTLSPWKSTEFTGGSDYPRAKTRRVTLPEDNPYQSAPGWAEPPTGEMGAGYGDRFRGGPSGRTLGYGSGSGWGSYRPNPLPSGGSMRGRR